MIHHLHLLIRTRSRCVVSYGPLTEDEMLDLVRRKTGGKVSLVFFRQAAREVTLGSVMVVGNLTDGWVAITRCPTLTRCHITTRDATAEAQRIVEARESLRDNT